MKILKIKLTLTEGMLGTSPADSKVYETYIGKNAPNAATLEEEIEALLYNPDILHEYVEEIYEFGFA